jgi:acetyltransferase-like isoleucine patch superfamily enzyme
MLNSHVLRRWVKAREHPLARFLYGAYAQYRGASIPVIPGVHRVLYGVHIGVSEVVSGLWRIAWITPLFRSRLTRPARGLYVYGGMPYIEGVVDITIGDDCRISGHTTIAGRSAGSCVPRLIVGRNCDIGWQTTIAVGRRIEIGDNVRIAGRAFLAGYPGHPLDPMDRAAGLPDTEDQVGDIIIEDGVWLATGITVLAGVRIGRGTVVGAGSVVNRDLPPNVLAAGVPARVLRPL